MVNPQEARRILDEHFDQITLDEFEARRDKYVVKENELLRPFAGSSEESSMILYQRDAAPLSLNAYLASALTDLTEKERLHLVAVYNIVNSVCKDLEIDLYEPRKAIAPVEHPDVKANDMYNMDRERALRSDLLVHVADFASAGADEEPDFARSALIPIILIAYGDTRVSRMITGIPALNLMIAYTSLDDLRDELRARLTEIRPILEQRKLAFSNFEKNMVGNKIKITRQESGLTREDVASHSGDVLTVERIRQIEGSPDNISNPALMELRTLAAVLKTTVADLVEPDLDERMIALLKEWMLKGVAARFPMNERDQRTVLRRILYRVLESTEEDPVIYSD